MKFLTLVFCAAALTASSSYGMKTAATATTKAPQASWGWKKHLASGLGKLVGGSIIPALSLAMCYPNAVTANTEKERAIRFIFWSSLPAIAGVGHTSFQSLKKAYSAYHGTPLAPEEKAAHGNLKTKLATSIGKLTGLVMPAYLIYYIYKEGIDLKDDNALAASIFLAGAFASAAVLTPPAYRSLKETYALYQEEKQANKTTTQKTA